MSQSDVQIADYPSQLEADIVLRNGSTLHVRPVRPEDEAKLLDMFVRLSRESLHSRFFDMPTPDMAVRNSPARVDYRDKLGLVGEVGDRIVAVAHYFRSPGYPARAEVAFTISDEMQGCGIGTRLLEKLAEGAREQGIEMFEADVLADSRKMMNVFLDSGFAVERKVDWGTVHFVLNLEMTTAYEDRAADRSQKAAAASMRKIFEPKSIAVIGAGRQRGDLGAEIFHNLIATGFKGRLYPVNSKATEVEYVPAYARVSDIPGEVDLAILVVPAQHVESVVDDCIQKKVGAIVVITAGFGEIGAEGKEREDRLVAKIRSAGIRMVGPNCMGVLNADPNVRLHATFSSVYPPKGNVAMSTQSGALGLAILEYARSLNIGFSTFISVGNKADVSGNDLIQYWAEDPRTDVILLYLESFGNPRKFGTIARRVARKKPIVAVKSGRSRSGARAASSHTGALAESDMIVRDLFRQAGIIRTDTLEEMFDVASLLANQPLPASGRVAILTNAGGPGILAADACEARGLEVATLSDHTTEELRSFLPREASVRNPIDMIASASAEAYGRAMQVLLKDENVDSLLVIYIPVVPEHANEVAAAIRETASSEHTKPILGTFMGVRGVPPLVSPVPCFPFPERAVGALGRVLSYAEWRRQPVGAVPQFDDIDRDRARLTVDRAMSTGGGWLDPDDVRELLDALRIPQPALEIARSEDEAVASARAIGFPVVLKALGKDILHKTNVGGVKLSLADDDAVREAFADLKSTLGDGMTAVAVQQMVTDGVEVMVGAVRDKTFGHLVLYGAGGTLVELLSDVVFGIHPISDVDATNMLEEVKCTSLLRGFRGSKPLDEAALLDTILRVSALLEICPEIEELDINPVKVLEKNCSAVDVRIRVAPVEPKPKTRRVSY